MGAFLCLAGATRADWPHLRGPAYDSVCQETGLAETWPEQGPPLVWSRELGQGYSGFIVAQGKVFTQCQTLGGQYLVCLNADTGQTVWEYRYDWAWQPGGAYPGPYATPTFYRGKIFYTSPTGLLGCVDAGSGKAIWSVNVRQRFQGPSHDFGFAATPLVEDDKVIVPIGGPSSKPCRPSCRRRKHGLDGRGRLRQLLSCSTRHFSRPALCGGLFAERSDSN